MSNFSHDASGKHCLSEANVGGAHNCELPELTKGVVITSSDFHNEPLYDAYGTIVYLRASSKH